MNTEAERQFNKKDINGREEDGTANIGLLKERGGFREGIWGGGKKGWILLGITDDNRAVISYPSKATYELAPETMRRIRDMMDDALVRSEGVEAGAT